jgi:hypothetical protein
VIPSEYMKKNPYKAREEAITECMEKTSCSRKTASGAWLRLHGTKGVIKNHRSQRGPISDLELDEKHDVFYKIEKAAASLVYGGGYYEDAAFRDTVCKISVNEYRRPSLDPLFDKYKGKAGGITYWGHPKSIAEKKQKGVLK